MADCKGGEPATARASSTVERSTSSDGHQVTELALRLVGLPSMGELVDSHRKVRVPAPGCHPRSAGKRGLDDAGALCTLIAICRMLVRQVTWSLLSRSAGRPYRLSLRPDALVRRHSLFGATLSDELGSLWPRPPTHCWIDPTECVDRHRLKADAAYYTPSRPWVLSDLDSRGLDSSAKRSCTVIDRPGPAPHVLRACMPTGNAVCFPLVPLP